MILPSSVSNFESFEEFKTFISGVLVTAIPAVSYANAQGLHCLKATGDACGGLRLR
ncbi:MAG: hypothetical protein ACYTXT_25705 [Nostoc sp.]|uniref:hypothetical protein n=1 Tax=unclassified Nostoc TaxID=2593658 RepID=UPI001D9F2341|nr:hypothetical protein [Nostoc sp. JL23]MBN3879996.1 hypothetical protein [Nostoc sp. JL23]